IDRAEPQGVDAEQLQVTQAVADPLQVPDPVTVGVGEAGHVDLVEDGLPPPLHGGILAERCNDQTGELTMLAAAYSRYCHSWSRCAGARPASSTAIRMQRSQASCSIGPTLNGEWRIRRRGWPRWSEYVRGPPQYCSRNIRSRSSAGPRSSSG